MPFPAEDQDHGGSQHFEGPVSTFEVPDDF